MGSRLLGIPRRRVLQLVRDWEVVLQPYQGVASGVSGSFTGPCRSSPYLGRYGYHQGAMPTIVDQILLDHKERDGTSLTEKVEVSGIAVSGRSLHVQDGTIWKHSNFSGSEERLRGQGPEGKRWLATYTRVTEEAARASNAATAVRYDEEEEVQNSKKNEKDPSPEDCDEAVEDLTSVRAKHKPKAKEVTKKPGDGWMTKVRNVIFGIGPAIRAIAAMSRCESTYFSSYAFRSGS
jgi:hypothetical protein